MNIPHFLCPFIIDGYLGSYLLAIMNNNNHHYKHSYTSFYVDMLSISWVYMATSGNARSHDNPVFNCLRNFPAVFQSDCIIYIPASTRH